MKRISYPIGERNLDGSNLIVREELSERINHGKVYLCECTCGNENCKGMIKVSSYYMKKAMSCADLSPRFEIGKPNIDGSFLIIREELSERYENGEKIYLCECTCGAENCKGKVKVRLSDLKKVKSCKRGRPKKKVKNAECNVCEVN